jgi:hypothetical protein
MRDPEGGGQIERVNGTMTSNGAPCSGETKSPKKEMSHLNLLSIFKKSQTLLDPASLSHLASHYKWLATLCHLFIVLGLFWPFQEQSFTSAKTIFSWSQILEQKSGKIKEIDQMGCEIGTCNVSRVIEKEWLFSFSCKNRQVTWIIGSWLGDLSHH